MAQGWMRWRFKVSRKPWRVCASHQASYLSFLLTLLLLMKTLHHHKCVLLHVAFSVSSLCCDICSICSVQGISVAQHCLA